ncbi:MAG TPA: helix-turn-helix transcriptional regulator [Holophaga sp.]|nr:helix-turn-helix transcriptional regulator [Holophaga sp.]
MDERTCLRILELPDGASMAEITQAYELMRRIYGREQAVFTAPSMDEFAPEAREEVLASVEAAFLELSRLHAQPQPQVRQAPQAEGGQPLDGPALRRVRERAGVSLDYVTSQVHIRPEYLRALEEERFADLPPAAVNVRGFLTAYAAELGLRVEDVVPDYMARFQQWQAHRRH